jgi:membrane-associated phospholipid phosphatase
VGSRPQSRSEVGGLARLAYTAPIRRLPVILALLLATATARADELRPLRWDPAVDGAILAGSLGLLVLGGVAGEALGPAACRTCTPGSLDDQTRHALVLPFTAAARTAAGAVATALVLGAGAEALLRARAHGAAGDGLVDVAVIAEATTLALDAGLVLQHAVGRQRPYVHYADWPGPVHRPTTDDNLSFPAGQVTLAFAVATAAGTVAYLRGSRLAPWVLGVGLGLATVVGYLRIAGDMNYLSDALAGAALGSAAGVAIPWLRHRPEDGPAAALRLVPAPGGFALLF